MGLIFENGRFYQSRGRFCEALLVDGDRIVATGSRAEMKALAPLGTGRMDCGGGLVLPGFNDSHLHLSCLAVEAVRPDIRACRSVDEMVEVCRRFLADHPDLTALNAMGWNQDLFDEGCRRMPLAVDLDRISTDIPVVLERVCGHVAAANGKALELRGVEPRTTGPAGGAIDRDETRRPTGLLRENAVSWMEAIMPDLTDEQKVSLFAQAMNRCAAMGLTSIQSNDVGAPNTCGSFKVIRALYERGLAKLRYRFQITFETAEAIDEFWAIEAANPAYDGLHLALGPLKLFKDGSLGARTALTREDYRDDRGNRGVEVTSDEKQLELCRAAAAHGMQVVTHVIGDAAVEHTLDVYEAVTGGGSNRLRHGLIHCQITDRSLLERIARLGVLALVQPIFLNYDLHIVESRCGRDLAETSYAFGTMAKLGIPVAYGTDAPVESPNPFPCLGCAVTRTDKDGYPVGGFVPGERVDVATAIDAYTLGSAYAEFAESYKGRLAPGYLADFTVPNDDLFAIDPQAIGQVKARMTVVGGEVVHQA